MRLAQIATVFAAIGSFASSAAPLEFGNITSETNVWRSPDIKCRSINDQISDCRLTRTSFAGVPIDDSMIMTDKAQRPTLVYIKAKYFYLPAALEALTARYGKPVADKSYEELNKQGGPVARRIIVWPAFDSGATLTLSTNGNTEALTVHFRWSQNQPPREAPKVDF